MGDPSEATDDMAQILSEIEELQKGIESGQPNLRLVPKPDAPAEAKSTPAPASTTSDEEGAEPTALSTTESADKTEEPTDSNATDDDILKEFQAASEDAGLEETLANLKDDEPHRKTLLDDDDETPAESDSAQEAAAEPEAQIDAELTAASKDQETHDAAENASDEVDAEVEAEAVVEDEESPATPKVVVPPPSRGRAQPAPAKRSRKSDSRESRASARSIPPGKTMTAKLAGRAQVGEVALQVQGEIQVRLGTDAGDIVVINDDSGVLIELPSGLELRIPFPESA